MQNKLLNFDDIDRRLLLFRPDVLAAISGRSQRQRDTASALRLFAIPMLSPADARRPHSSTPTRSRPSLRSSRDDYAGRERELRTAVAQRLKAALAEGRAGAEQLLLQDRHGRTLRRAALPACRTTSSACCTT